MRRFTVKAFDRMGNVENPATGWMVLNVAAYAMADATVVQLLPIDYDAQRTWPEIPDAADRLEVSPTG